jgi:L-lactate dehydrogenase (cytochrome)
VIPASVDDLRLLAGKRLPRFLFDYIEGGACGETTVRRNRVDLEQIELRQRILRDVSSIDLTTSLLGQPSSLPVALGPIGLAGLYACRGEVQAAKAAESAGVPFILSASSCCPLDEVAAALGAAPMFQLYMIKDRRFMEAMLDRVAASGVRTLVMTVDLIMHSVRYRDVRSTLTGNQSLAARAKRTIEMIAHPGWAWHVGVRGRPHTLGNFAAMMPEGAGLAQFTRWVSRNFDPSLTWDDLAWLKDRWRGRIALKGILDGDDAVRACDAGADALVVSNHGGRQLDGAPSTISVLPAIVDAVAGRTEVLADGGIRSGTDILRALASGASGVLLGRAWAYALAARGGAGVTLMLEMLRKELTVAMALTGNTDVKTVGRDTLM